MKAIKITPTNQKMLATRYLLDLDAFPLEYVMVTEFGDNGDYRYEGVLTEVEFNEKFVKVAEIGNGFWDVVRIPVEDGGNGGNGEPEPEPIVYSDDFNRADLTPAPAPWSDNKWISFSGKFYRDMFNGANEFIRYGIDLGSIDHWVEADIAGFSGQNIMLHARSSGPIGQNMYLAWLAGDGTSKIGKIVGGNYTELSIGSNYGVSDYKARLEVEGTAIRLYRNGTLVLSVTDSLLDIGNYVGLSASFNTSSFDNFRCGPLPYTEEL